jgi:hypothetical protein
MFGAFHTGPALVIVRNLPLKLNFHLPKVNQTLYLQTTTKMAKRFASVENEELDNIQNNRDSTNTKNVIRMATNVLREYAFTITMITEIQFCF